MTPFCSNSQFLDRYDGRWVGKNMLDTNAAASIADLANTATEAGARLELLLSDAAEELMSAAAVGARYTEADLRTYGGSLVVSINAGLAMGPVLERRSRTVDNFEKVSAAYKRAAARVEQLRKGERIFWAVPNVPEAGQPQVTDTTPVVGIDCPNLTQESGRYFGNTGNCNGSGNCGNGGW